jgi:head-tail adaptor
VIGRLTEVIAIDREDPPADEEGDPFWVEVARMRASAKPVRASEAEREGAVREIQVYLFTVLTSALRSAPVSATGHRLRWKGRAMNIREVRRPVDQEHFTEIVAESGVGL